MCGFAGVEEGAVEGVVGYLLLSVRVTKIYG